LPPRPGALRFSQRVQDFIGRGKLKVLFNSNPVEFRQDSVLMEVNGAKQTIPNDYAWMLVESRRRRFWRTSAWALRIAT